MATRLVQIIATSAVALAAPIFSVAADDKPPKPIVITSGDSTGVTTRPKVGVEVTDPGAPGGGGQPQAAGEGRASTCGWVPAPDLEAWVRRLPAALPAGGRDWVDPKWRLYERTCSGLGSGFAWFGPGAGPAATPPTPQELGREAYGELRLPAPTPGRSPDLRLADGQPALLVGEHTWLWTSGSVFSARSRTVRAGGVWATVTARPVGLSVDPGTGDPVTGCVGSGTPFVPGRYAPHAASPTCDVVLGRSSARFRGGVVTATWAIRWRVSWVGAAGGAGESGVFADLTSRTPVVLAVAEAQALVTG